MEEMEKAERWAVGFGSFMGALVWFAGAWLQVHLFTLLLLAASLVVASGTVDVRLDEWFIFGGSALVGVVTTAVGGGLRVLAGLMNGEKVAGRLAGKILLYHWARYELFALSVAGLLSGFAAANLEFPLLLILTAFVVGAVASAQCYHLAKRYGARSKALMWRIREEGIRSGMVPYPTEAVAPGGDITIEKRS